MRGIAPICALVLLVAAAAPASAGKPKKELEKAVKAQVTALFEYEDTAGPYADGAQFTTGLGDEGVVDAAGLRKAMQRHVREWGYVKKVKIGNLKVAIDDAKEPIGGWASFTVKVTMVEDEQGDAPASFELRATEAWELQDDGWKVLAGHWSRPVTDKSAHTDAKKGKLGALAALPETPIEDQVTIAYSAMMSAGDGAFELIASVSNRTDVAVFSTDAKKPRMGGKVNKKAWKTWWKAVKADATFGGQNRGKQIGWVFANLTVQKKGYTIPVRAFLVLSLEEDGGLNVVAGHLSVPYKPEWE